MGVPTAHFEDQEVDDVNVIAEKLRGQCKQFEWKLLGEVERRQALERDIEEQKLQFQGQMAELKARLDEVKCQRPPPLSTPTTCNSDLPPAEVQEELLQVALATSEQIPRNALADADSNVAEELIK